MSLPAGVFGAVDVLNPSCADIRRHVHVIADGVDVALPPGAQGIILLNINSYLGGVRMWDEGEARRGWFGEELDEGRVLRRNSGIVEKYRDVNRAERVRDAGYDGGDGGVDAVGRGDADVDADVDEYEFGASSAEDGLVDVMVIYGAFQLGQLSMGTDRATRICQARNVRLVLDRELPVQVDGQPWEQPVGQCVLKEPRSTQSNHCS